jgi:hypothetical protein
VSCCIDFTREGVDVDYRASAPDMIDVKIIIRLIVNAFEDHFFWVFGCSVSGLR